MDRAEYHRAYAAANRERLSEYHRAYYLEHAEEIKAYQRRCYHARIARKCKSILSETI